MNKTTITRNVIQGVAIASLFFITACGAEAQWRQLDENNTVLMTLPSGKVVIELAPQFSPKHVAQFIKLTKQGHYNGNKFYRVIDGFVAQAGPKDGSERQSSANTCYRR